MIPRSQMDTYPRQLTRRLIYNFRRSQVGSPGRNLERDQYRMIPLSRFNRASGNLPGQYSNSEPASIRINQREAGLHRAWGKISSMGALTSRPTGLSSGENRQESSVSYYPHQQFDDEYGLDLARSRRELSSRSLSITDFCLGTTVGTGSFGRVCVATLKGGRSYLPPMVIKIFSKEKVIRTKQVEHVKDERRILSIVEHPFIVNLLTAFQDETGLYMVMEYVNGGELFARLRHVGRFTPSQARFYAAEIVLVFQYLHSLGIAYRDLKPENILLDRYGHVKITDFGFAKFVEDRTWTLCGTHEYLAPETIMRRGHGMQVDWWALGILIFEMLAEHPPFYDENPVEIYRKIMACRLVFPPHFDSAARSLVRKLLVTDPSRRLGSWKNGAEDVKAHRFFQGVDWIACYQRKLPVPYVPEVAGPMDTSMFDTYPDAEPSHAPPLDPDLDALFEDF